MELINDMTKISLQTYLKPVHIKSSNREYFQIFKNFFIFYDHSFEHQLAKGDTVLDYVKRMLEHKVFTMSRRPKIIKRFIDTVHKIQSTHYPGKLPTFDMKESDFIKYFTNEHITGPCQVIIKKLMNKQVATNLNYIPIDQINVIPERTLKKDFASVTSKH